MTTKRRPGPLADSFAGFTAVCGRAAHGDYIGALRQLGGMPDGPAAADPVREVLNDVLGEIVKCDHKFVDSDKCLKCGWKPPQQGTAT